MPQVQTTSNFNLTPKKGLLGVKCTCEGTTVADHATELDKRGLTYYATLNGEALSKKEYETTVLKNGDRLAFIILPKGGGGGSDVMDVVILVVAVALGVFFSPSVGMTFYGIASTIKSVLTPLPSFDSPISPKEASSTYNVGAQGNQARLGAAIPSIYGVHQVYPDFAASPYVRYQNNEQYVYQLMAIGYGYYELEDFRLAGTGIDQFEEVTYEIIEPGQNITLFDHNVVTAVEVSGLELSYNVPKGAFTVNPAGTEINKIEIDIVFPRGLYEAGGSTFGDVTVTWKVEARRVDDDGIPIDAQFTVLGNETKTANDNTPLRFTYTYNLTNAGRYEVRLTRTSEESDEAKIIEDITWERCKGYVTEKPVYEDITLVALKMRATNNLSQRSSREFNCIAKRKIPTWSPDNGWTEPQLTSSIAWAIADVCRSANGGGLRDSRIDLDRLYELDQIWQSRGDYFNGVFDTTRSIHEALQMIAQVGRAKVYSQGGLITLFRDQAESIVKFKFDERSIVKDSFNVTYSLPSEDMADSILVEYFDARTWKMQDVEAALPDSPKQNQTTLQLFGCTSKEQALREGLYMCAANKYRRIQVTFDTELLGALPELGDKVAISHQMPNWGKSGDVAKVDGNTLTLSERVAFIEGETHVVAFNDEHGKLVGPFRVTEGYTEYEVVLDEEIGEFHISTNENRERTRFSFGTQDNWAQYARIISIKPRSQYRFTITAVVENELVHTADQVS